MKVVKQHKQIDNNFWAPLRFLTKTALYKSTVIIIIINLAELFKLRVTFRLDIIITCVETVTLGSQLYFSTTAIQLPHGNEKEDFILFLTVDIW